MSESAADEGEYNMVNEGVNDRVISFPDITLTDGRWKLLTVFVFFLYPLPRKERKKRHVNTCDSQLFTPHTHRHVPNMLTSISFLKA